MADLEADAEDADEENWDDEGVEKELDHNDIHMSDSNGTHLEHPNFNKAGEDEHPARTSSRILSAQTEQGSSPLISSLASNFLMGTDQAASSTTPASIMYRRNASRTNTQSFAGDPAVPRLDTIDRSGPSFPNYPRPVTPILSISNDPETTPDASPSGGPDMLTTDGPMTPTNHAGPFVFDGSGSRRGGQSPASDVGSSE